MKIAGFDVQYVSHVCFHITAPDGAVVVTDPFFAGGFPYRGHWEKHLSPPAIAPGDIRRCDILFISHIHGDHFDPDGVETLAGNTGAEVCAPPDVIEALQGRKIGPRNLVPLADGAQRRMGGTQLTFLAGYDRSFDEKGRPNKFSFLLESVGGRLFYSGDCHEAPPAMAGQRVDAVLAWAHPDERKLAAFLNAIPCEEYVLMHGDRFEPGKFFCNTDSEQERARVMRAAPGVRVIIPSRCSRGPL